MEENGQLGIFGIMQIALDAYNTEDKAMIDILIKSDKFTKSILLRHEICYMIGQMEFSDESMIFLKNLYADKNENSIVRHEAAEALANLIRPLSKEKGLDLIQFFRENLQSDEEPLVETIEVAIRSLLNPRYLGKSDFNTLDPIPIDNSEEQNINDLIQIFTKTNEKENNPDYHDILANKYETLFKMRTDYNKSEFKDLIGQTITAQLANAQNSSLFRHELAFVLGQIIWPKSKDVLFEVLLDEGAHEMVRHECAIAIGAIFDYEQPSDTETNILTDLCNHENKLIAESCQVALKMNI